MPEDDAALNRQHEVWEAWAQADPMWAILSEPDMTNGRWNVDDFFATGRQEIAVLMAELSEKGLSFNRGTCMDFGCGMGRLTQALGAEFDHADGVDIADTMIDLARQYNRLPDKVAYHLNVADDLSLFEDGRFDFIYSTIVLQHNPPPAARRYIEEFVRILATGGLAVFDMPTRAVHYDMPEGSHKAAVELVALPGRLPAGGTVWLRVKATNTSEIDWPAGTGLKFGNHWKSVDGDMLVYDDGRAEISEAVKAGESVTRPLKVTLPTEPGRYRLEVDLVEEMICWFGTQAEHQNDVPAVEVEIVDPAEAAAATASEDLPPEAEMPELFTMNGLPQADVEEAIVLSGGETILTHAADVAGGNWESLRYYVRRLDPATAAPRVAEAAARRAVRARVAAQSATDQLAAAETALEQARAAAANTEAEAQAAQIAAEQAAASAASFGTAAE